MKHIVHKYIKQPSAVKIALGIEAAIRDGALRSGQRLATVRGLADLLEVSPATVAAAYRRLKLRGIVVTAGRRGTRVSHRPLHPSRRRQVGPRGTRNLFDGNPDPALLPVIAPILRRIDPSPRLYGEPPHHGDLIKLVRRELVASGVAAGELCVTNGAIDAIDRLLAEHLRPGDRVAVEDPGFTGILDLVMSRGLSLVPVEIDEEGPMPERLQRACAEGARAFIVTPRVQSPTGAALSEARARELRRVLRTAPDLLVIEDDHANRIADTPLYCLHDPKRARWAHVHSFSKSINPDLRMALMTGDDHTMARVQDRLIIGERWVSHLLQRIAYALLSDAGVRRHLRRAAVTYTRRRKALLEALRGAGFSPWGRSGYNVWVPVAEETSTVQALAAAGWAVSAGERFRLGSPPAIRITASTLEPEEAKRFAADLAAALGRSPHTATV